MKITLAAIGKMKAGSPEAQLVAEYTKRLAWKVTVKEFDIKHQDAATRQAKEIEALLGATQGCDVLIALDERGKDASSRELAQTFAQWQQRGLSHVGIIIGGADGLNDTVRKQAKLLLAFGRATWPHMMVRAMLAEQLYRISTILDNHPYHRD